MEEQVIIWLIIGVILIVAEIIIPGAVLFFIGASCVLTGLLIHFGHISGFVEISLTFFLSSIFMVLLFRSLFLRLLPGKSTVSNTDELQDSLGDMVEVVETITPYRRGRIRYRGTTWDAQSDHHLEQGEKAIIEGRDGQCWIIRPLVLRGVNIMTAITIATLIVLFLLKIFLVSVPMRQAFVIERLGKFQRVMNPGLRFMIPIIDRIAYRREIREQMHNIPPQHCITKDNIQVTLDGLIYIKVLNPELASYGIADYKRAAVNLAQTTMRAEVGKLDLGQIFSERESLNENIVKEIDRAAEVWGVKVMRYEVANIDPSDNVVHTLEKKMIAERERRKDITLATADKEAKINVSEGERQESINISLGERQKRINLAEGKAKEIELLAQAQAEGIRLVAEAINQPGGDKALQMRLVERFIEELGTIMEQSDISVLPAEMARVKGIFEGIDQVSKQFTPPQGVTNAN